MCEYKLYAVHVSSDDLEGLATELEGARCAVFGDTGSLIIDLSDTCDSNTKEVFDSVLEKYGVYSTDADYFHIYA